MHNAFFLAERRPAASGAGGAAGRGGWVRGGPRQGDPGRTAAGLTLGVPPGATLVWVAAQALLSPSTPASTPGGSCPGSPEPRTRRQRRGWAAQAWESAHFPNTETEAQRGRRPPPLPLGEGPTPRPGGLPSAASGTGASPWPGAPLMRHLSEHTRALSAGPGRGRGGRGGFPAPSPRLTAPYLLAAL